MDDPLRRCLLAMKDGAVMLREKAVARGAVELTPGTTIGMTIGPQVGQPQPAALVTIAVRAAMPGRVHGTGASVRGQHGIGPSRRRWCVIHRLRLTQGTGRLLRQARERYGFAGASARGLDRLGWCLGFSTGWARPEVRQHEAQPEQDQDHQLIVNEVRNHRIAPLHDGIGGPFYPVFRPQELSAVVRYTTTF